MTSWSRTGSPLGTWFVLVMETISMFLYLEAGDELISTGYTWLIWLGSTCSPVLSFPQYSERSQHWCCLVCCWPLLQMNGWLGDLRDQGWNFQSCLVGLNLELPLCLVGPFTDGFENSSLHCVRGTEVPWQLTPEKGVFAFPHPFMQDGKSSISSVLTPQRQGIQASPNLPRDCFHSIRLISDKHRVPLVQVVSQGRIQP